jgi:membrane-bound ClpP family serine protease
MRVRDGVLGGVGLALFLVGFALKARDRGVSLLEAVMILVAYVAVVAAVALVVERVRNPDH